MKKVVLLIVIVAAVISFSGCAGRENESIADVEPIESVAESFDTETVTNTDEEAYEEEHSRILIAYFTWAENTYTGTALPCGKYGGL